MNEPSDYEAFREQSMRSIAESLGLPSQVVCDSSWSRAPLPWPADDPCDWAAKAARPIEDVTRAIVALDAAFSQSKEALWLFSHAIVRELARYFVAERLYLRVHRRLPGSLRTARLRKKRITKVIAWYERLLRLARSAGKPICADCLGPIGRDNGPRDGWELEDGRTVCQACAADDLRQLSAAMISGARS